MPRGGRRPGADRKPKLPMESERLRALTAQAISDEAWIAILKGLGEEAQYGDIKSAELLVEVAFGVTVPKRRPPSRRKS